MTMTPERRKEIRSAFRHACTRLRQCYRRSMRVPDDEGEDSMQGWLEGILEITATSRANVKVLLSWGGPSDGFIMHMLKGGKVLSATYFYDPWFAHYTRKAPDDIREILEVWLGEAAEAAIVRYLEDKDA